MIFENLSDKHIRSLAPSYVRTYNAPPWDDEWTVELAAKRLDEIINCRDSMGLVCLDEENSLVGMVVGSFETYYNHKQFYIKDYFIVPEYQGKGNGTLLMEKLETELINKGIDKVYLLTSRTEQTEGFYQKRGYVSWRSMVVMGKILNERSQSKEGYVKATDGLSRMNNDLLINLDKIRTTELGVKRIKKNLSLATENVVEWCKVKMEKADDVIRKGKNWYVYVDDCIITINAYSFTIITAHKKK